MSTQTEQAYCGGCGAPMALVRLSSGLWQFRCSACDEETTPRESIQEADLDAVWVPVWLPHRKKE